jgi:hypothetical protein
MSAHFIILCKAGFMAHLVSTMIVAGMTDRRAIAPHVPNFELQNSDTKVIDTSFRGLVWSGKGTLDHHRTARKHKDCPGSGDLEDNKPTLA